MKNAKHYLLIPVLILLLSYQCVAQIYHIDSPSRIVLSLTESPANGMTVTWRTTGENNNSFADIAVAGDWINFAENAQRIIASSEKVLLDNNQAVFSHSVVFKELKPSTLYAYRVGSASGLSEWNQFRTASDKHESFSFIYLGDPQNEIKEYVSRIFRAAYKETPDAAFWVIAGDLTTEPTLDSLWDEFFYAAGFIPSSTPIMPVPGNHEYRKNPKVKNDSKEKRITPMWRPHFTLPENGVKGLEETSYYFDYQGARFIMLNGTENIEDQIEWLDELLSRTKSKWKIVIVHQPVYSTGKDRDNPEYREKLTSVYDKHSVDLVLQGHDHTYGRTYKVKGNKVVSSNEQGTVYAVSVSGPKAYELNPKFKELMVKTGGNVQLFQTITISGNKLDYKSYTVTGKLFDSFELIK